MLTTARSRLVRYEPGELSDSNLASLVYQYGRCVSSRINPDRWFPVANDVVMAQEEAADAIARHVNRWPGMIAPQLTGATVVAWRAQQRRSKSKEFAALVGKTLDEADPRATVTGLLRSGPPGLFR